MSRTTRVLVTGAGGQVGRELVSAFDGLDVIAADRAALDVADRDAVLGTICSLQPDLVINAAAYTVVDDCETDVEGALAVNAIAVRHLAEGCRRVGGHLVHLSTDYVFDGTKGSPYHEWDDPNPQSVYARSKLGGEREVDPEFAVVRTTWVFGRHGNNLVKTILRLAEGDAPLRFVDDQQACPTAAADLAVAVRRLAVGRLPGMFHVTNQGATTPYELARTVLRLAGHDPERVVPITTAEMGRPAPRPADSRLDHAALRLVGHPLLPDHHEPLEHLVKELVAS